MNKVLVLNSSILGKKSASNRLVNEFLRCWQERHSGDEITQRDLSVDEIPHLSGETFFAWTIPEEKRTPAQKSAVALSDELTQEFLSADVMVIGLPMYNFGVPSSFKAYIDHITRLGLTFGKTAEGRTVGLAGEKKVYVLGSRGGIYWNTPADLQTPYINQIMQMFGIENVQYVVAEGLLRPEPAAAESIALACAEISMLIELD